MLEQKQTFLVRKKYKQNPHLPSVRAPTTQAELPRQFFETGVAVAETWSIKGEEGIHPGRWDSRREKETRQR